MTKARKQVVVLFGAFSTVVRGQHTRAADGGGFCYGRLNSKKMTFFLPPPLPNLASRFGGLWKRKQDDGAFKLVKGIPKSQEKVASKQAQGQKAFDSGGAGSKERIHRTQGLVTSGRVLPSRTSEYAYAIINRSVM